MPLTSLDLDSLGVNLDTLALLPEAITPPDKRFPSRHPDAHFATTPRLAPEQHPLLAVSASYAALTMRCSERVSAAARTYPLVLLAGWLWDDLVDHNKDSPDIRALIEQTLAEFARVLRVQATTRRAWNNVLRRAPLTPLSESAARAAQFLEEAVIIVDAELPLYSQRIRTALWEFLSSFEAKAELRQLETHSVEAYSAVRVRCVGMLMCFEVAYALKATAMGISAEEALAYTTHPEVARGARAATLHCAAVNDLFSLYKDRQLEGTPNFPSVMAPDRSVDGYWTGARRTLELVRSLTDETLTSLENLALPASLRRVVAETWLEMMEGNVLFHLTVPRYREGVAIVRDLTDPSLLPEQNKAAFRRSFPPAALPHDAAQPISA